MEGDIPAEFYEDLKPQILMQIDKDEYDKGCWKWTGYESKVTGYGQVHLSIPGKKMCVYCTQSFIHCI